MTGVQTCALPISYGDQHSKPIADGNLTQQHTSSQDRSDGSAVRAFDEPLHVRILSMPNEDRSDKEDEQKRGQKDPDGRNQRSPEASHQITDKRRGDHHGPGA